MAARPAAAASTGTVPRPAAASTAAEIVEATRSIVTSMAGYHGRLVAQAIATAYR